MRKRGFTLIEILVVCAIIAILTTIVIAGLDVIRSKGRDAKRIADIKQIQGAVENYFSSCFEFPENDSLSVLTEGDNGCPNYKPVLNVLPAEGQAGHSAYGYFVDSNGASGGQTNSGKRFHLCAFLENSYGTNKGKAGVGPFDGTSGADPCNGAVGTTFDIVGGAY